MTDLVLETVQWSSLSDIDDIDRVGPADVAVLDELRSVLQRHGMLARFGVCLLHKHFEVGADEVAIEHTDQENRISRVTVEPRSGLTDLAIETNWRFRDDGPQMATVCVQKCAPGGSTHSTIHPKQSR